jgi:hypothetical protein
MARINHISAPRKANPTRYGLASLEPGLAPYDSAALCRIRYSGLRGIPNRSNGPSKVGDGLALELGILGFLRPLRRMDAGVGDGVAVSVGDGVGVGIGGVAVGVDSGVGVGVDVGVGDGGGVTMTIGVGVGVGVGLGVGFGVAVGVGLGLGVV